MSPLKGLALLPKLQMGRKRASSLSIYRVSINCIYLLTHQIITAVQRLTAGTNVQNNQSSFFQSLLKAVSVLSFSPSGGEKRESFNRATTNKLPEHHRNKTNRVGSRLMSNLIAEAIWRTVLMFLIKVSYPTVKSAV